ncbi:hypothetical protein [Ensifer adhaerens]|nr:hypothetical protein [Ensifer adhaerens]
MDRNTLQARIIDCDSLNDIEQRLRRNTCGAKDAKSMHDYFAAARTK